MHKIWLFVLLLPLISLGQQQGSIDIVVSENGGVHFLENLSWQQVKEKARAEHKHILVDYYATWCGPCKAMERNTFPVDTVGHVINNAFLAVRVQGDTTTGDAQTVKNWYADAHQMMVDYGITAYPTFLFFSPQGDIIHKAVGYQNPADFIALMHEALDIRTQYRGMAEAYRQGRLPYNRMPDLVKVAGLLKDTAIRSAVARDYINYLNKLPDSAWQNKENLIILSELTRDLRSSDKAVVWLMQHRMTADSLICRKGFADGIMESIIYSEEVSPFVEIAKRNSTPPEWQGIDKHIAAKYGNEYVKKMITRGRMKYYEFMKDWKNFCKALIERVDANDFLRNPAKNGLALNNSALQIFQLSSDPQYLTTAVKWMDSALASIAESSPGFSDMLETRAELLYKLGRKEEAIPMQARAVGLTRRKEKRQQYQKALDKMYAGQPTW